MVWPELIMPRIRISAATIANDVAEALTTDVFRGPEKGSWIGRLGPRRYVRTTVAPDGGVRVHALVAGEGMGVDELAAVTTQGLEEPPAVGRWNWLSAADPLLPEAYHVDVRQLRRAVSWGPRYAGIDEVPMGELEAYAKAIERLAERVRTDTARAFVVLEARLR